MKVNAIIEIRGCGRDEKTQDDCDSTDYWGSEMEHQDVADNQEIHEYQENRKKTSSLFSRMRERIRKNRDSHRAAEMTGAGDIERVASEVIAEVVGEGGLLDQKLGEYLKECERSGYPLGKKEAEENLLALLEMAAGYRTVLSERIAQNVTKREGVLLRDFRQRMEKINILAADTYTALDRMQAARENAIYQRDISNAVTERVHEVAGLNLDPDARKAKAEAAKGEVGDKIRDEIKG